MASFLSFMVPDAFKNKSGKAFALCVVLFVVGILVVLSFTLWLLLSGEIIELYDTVNEYRGLGGLMFGMIFAIANLPFMVGYGILLMINGLIFGFWWGMLIAVIGSFCGWFPSFILVRKVFFADAKHVGTAGESLDFTHQRLVCENERRLLRPFHYVRTRRT